MTNEDGTFELLKNLDIAIFPFLFTVSKENATIFDFLMVLHREGQAKSSLGEGVGERRH